MDGSARRDYRDSGKEVVTSRRGNRGSTILSLVCRMWRWRCEPRSAHHDSSSPLSSLHVFVHSENRSNLIYFSRTALVLLSRTYHGIERESIDGSTNTGFEVFVEVYIREYKTGKVDFKLSECPWPNLRH